MKITIIFTLFLITKILTQTPGDEQFKPLPPQTQKYCGRNLVANLDPPGRVLTVSTVSTCSGQQGRANNLSFTLSSVDIPTFGLLYKTKAQMDQGPQGKPFETTIGFDKLIYYKEVNGIPGYQEGNDTIVDTYMFNAKQRPTGPQNSPWSQIMLVKQPPTDGSAPIFRAFTQLRRRTDQTGFIYIGVEMTPNETLYQRNTSLTTTTSILSPNSFKLNLNFTGLIFPSGADGFALGAVLRIGGDATQKPPQATQPDQERPDDATPQQGVLNVQSDDDPNASGSFFSWKNFIEAKKNGVVVSRGVIVGNVTLIVNNDGGFPTEDGKNLKRVYFSVVDNTITEFLWDPSLGAIETNTITSGGLGLVVRGWLLFLLNVVLLGLIF